MRNRKGVTVLQVMRALCRFFKALDAKARQTMRESRWHGLRCEGWHGLQLMEVDRRSGRLVLYACLAPIAGLGGRAGWIVDFLRGLWEARELGGEYRLAVSANQGVREVDSIVFIA